MRGQKHDTSYMKKGNKSGIEGNVDIKKRDTQKTVKKNHWNRSRNDWEIKGYYQENCTFFLIIVVWRVFIILMHWEKTTFLKILYTTTMRECFYGQTAFVLIQRLRNSIDMFSHYL